MSEKKPETDIQHIDTIRCIIGFGAFAAAFVCEKEIERQMGETSVLLLLLMLGYALLL